MGRRRQWIYVREPARYKPAEDEKAAITAACEQFIAEVLKPRFLPEIRPTPYNYPIDIFGKWHGGKYRFIQRFRSDHPDAIEPEFDAPFARSNRLAATVSTCPTTGIRASGSAYIGPSH